MLPESDRGTMRCVTPPTAWEPSPRAKQQTSAEEEERRPRAAPAPVSGSWQLARKSYGRPDPRPQLLGGELEAQDGE